MNWYFPCLHGGLNSLPRNPTTGNTQPSCICVIQKYRFYNMSLSQYHWCCQYHEFMCILWFHVHTMSPCLYLDSMSPPWGHVYTMISCLYYESIPWVNVYSMISCPYHNPCLYHESFQITRVIVYTMSPKILIKEEKKKIEAEKT